VSPELRTRLTNITTDLSRAMDAVAQYDKTEGEVEDMTIADIKLAFEGLRSKIATCDRVVAMLKATVDEDWA